MSGVSCGSCFPTAFSFSLDLELLWRGSLRPGASPFAPLGVFLLFRPAFCEGALFGVCSGNHTFQGFHLETCYMGLCFFLDFKGKPTGLPHWILAGPLKEGNTHIYIYIYIYICTWKCTYTSTYIYIYTYIYIVVCIEQRTSECSHIYIYMYTHIMVERLCHI